MPDTITISVTAGLIGRGERFDCTKCPIALAASKLGLRGVRVFCEGIRWAEGEKQWSALLPDEAVDFAHRFDNGAKVSPFSFDITPIY